MHGELEKEGHYELFETNHGHKILVLNNKNWYAIIKGDYGDLLVKTDSDHKKKRTIQEGKFYLADFEDDPEFRDVPHLFLKDGKEYKEFILPNDLPGNKNYQKKLVRTGDKVSAQKVEEHVKGRGNKGSEKQYKDEEQNKPRSAGDLENKSVEELQEMARKKNIEGRSNMNKDELIKKLRE